MSPKVLPILGSDAISISASLHFVSGATYLRRCALMALGTCFEASCNCGTCARKSSGAECPVLLTAHARLPQATGLEITVLSTSAAERDGALKNLGSDHLVVSKHKEEIEASHYAAVTVSPSPPPLSVCAHTLNTLTAPAPCPFAIRHIRLTPFCKAACQPAVEQLERVL